MSSFMQTLQDFKEALLSTPGGIGPSDITCAVNTAFLGSPSFKVVLVFDPDDPSLREKVRLTISGTSITQMERNWPTGGTGQSHAQNCTVRMTMVSDLFNDLQEFLESGWSRLPNYLSLAYVSTSSFTVQGDWTGVFNKGDRIRLQNGSTKYFYVGSTSYGGGLTTVNVLGGSDYALAAGTVSDVYYSKVENPAGFPNVFNFSPGIGGLASGGTSTKFGTFTIRGGRCYVDGQFNCGTATYSGSVFSLTAPIAAKSGTNVAHVGSVWATDSGTSQIFGSCYLLPGTTDINLLLGGSGFPTQQAAGNYPITWANGDVWKVSINYPI